MDKIKIAKENLVKLKSLFKDKEIIIEGNILDYIDISDEEVSKYINKCKIKCDEKEQKRLSLLTQLENEKEKTLEAISELKSSNQKIKDYSNKLEKARKLAVANEEKAKNDLVVLSKKTQLETFDRVAKVMIYSIVGGIIIINLLFGYILVKGVDNQILMTTWASIMTMVFTNAFSIIATIMGVKKFAQEIKKDGEISTSYEK